MMYAFFLMSGIKSEQIKVPIMYLILFYLAYLTYLTVFYLVYIFRLSCALKLSTVTMTS